MDEKGDIYRVAEAKGKTPEEIKADEERLMKALQKDFDGVIGEQLKRLAQEEDE